MRRIAVTSIVLAVFLLVAPSAIAQVGGEAPSPSEETRETETEQPADEEKAEEPAEESEEQAASAANGEAEQPAYAGSMQESKASQERTIPGGTLAIASYILLWLMTMAFVGMTARRQSQLAEELETLEQRMDSVVGTFDDEV